MHNTLHAFIMVIYAECGLGIVTAEELLISDKFQKLKFQKLQSGLLLAHR